MNIDKNSTTELGCSADSLLSMLPEIRRARGWRLYAADGRRILSLWSDHGRNLLGYNPRGLAEHAKSALDRGLIAPTPGAWNERIARMIHRLYPEYPIVRLQSSAAHTTRAEHARFLFDNYLHDEEFERAMRQEPIQIILPTPEALSLDIVGFESKPLEDAESKLVDGMRGACAIFALSLMASEKNSGMLTARFEESWRRFDRCGVELFSRSGPWLRPKYSREAHRELFAFCATRGVLISPEYEFPSSVPGDFDEGELHCLQEAASAFL